MVQNCCASCMGKIGEFVCFVLCCQCCCCCKKKQKEPDIAMVHSSMPQNEFGSNADDESVYNGSSMYSEPSVVKRQPYTESATSGIYMSESSAYSGSIIENKNDFKLEFACEIKGTVEVGGTQQPVKGVLHIVPDDNRKRPLPEKPSIYAVNPGLSNNINNFHKNSKKDSFGKQDIFNKTPKPLPRTPETQTIRNSEIYFSDKDNNSILEDNHYDEPKPPLPVKNRKLKDPTESYVPVYENFDWKTSNSKTVSTDDNTSRDNNSKFPEKDASSNSYDNSDEHIYEDINPNYDGPYSKEQLNSYKSEEIIDYEIYMS